MKAKTALLIMMLFTCFPTLAQEDIDADFLEFLIEMEEVTGDGFESWLETDTEKQSTNENEKDSNE